MDAGQSGGLNTPGEQFILPERVTVRDPNGSQYVIERVLGKGEFGAVYLVRERGQNQQVFALKEVINPNNEERVRFAFEAEILYRLDHPALPRVHRIFENANLKRVYVLMDYIEGKNLEDLRQEQPGKYFSLPVAMAMIAPIIDALIYLHGQDPPIVHRDIKPANIILPVSGEAMLVDFGSAKEYVPDSNTTMLVRRSPGYAAPEQYRKGTSPATDIYGLGATLYALLTGITPVNAPFRVTENWTTGVDPVKPAHLLKPEIPVAVSQTLQQALSIFIEDRIETVEQFQQALLPEREPVESDAQPAQKAQPVRISPKRRALLLCAMLLVIVAIGTGIFFYLRGYTLLLLCSLGLFLLALGGLLISVMMRRLTVRAGRMQRRRGRDTRD